MRRDHRQPAGSRPFDLEADRQADVTQQFWGATRDWEPRSDDRSDDRPGHDVSDAMWAERTGSMRAIRDSLAAFKPRRNEPSHSGRIGRIDRTRSHGIVRQAVDDAQTDELRRVSPEASLADLAAGRRAQLELDWPDEDDWSLPDSLHTGATARVAAARLGATGRESTGAVRRTRSHTGRLTAVPVGGPAQRSDHDGHDDDHDDDADLIPLTPTAPLVERLGLGAVDPLLVRLGALVLAGVLAVPFALASRGAGDDALASANVVAAVGAPTALDPSTPGADPQASPAPVAEAAPPLPAEATSAVVDEAPATAAGAPSGAVAESTDPASSADDDAATPTADDVQDVATATTTPPEVAVATADAVRLEPECALVYTAVVGDSWYRIAEAAGVSMEAVLDANLAGIESVILPGDEICLPEGATIPSPPTTAAPTTTAAPATTVPTTTTAPTTAAPAAPASTAEVQRLIREIWPDELEEQALQVAWRESNYKATAYNGICCWGVFQMHWTAHKSWLDDYGIFTTSDLLDARKNITAAYALYQRAGGWGPWGG